MMPFGQASKARQGITLKQQQKQSQNSKKKERELQKSSCKLCHNYNLKSSGLNATSTDRNFNSNNLNGVILKSTLDKKLSISIEKNPLKCDCYSAVIKEQENYSNIKIFPQNFLCEEGGISLLSKEPEDLLCPAVLVGADCSEGCECEVSTLMS